jgi:MFS family permease
VKGFSLTMTGVSLFPITFTVLPAGAIVGILTSRIGRFRWAVWGGWCIAVLGSGLLILLSVRTNTASWVFIFIVAGLGHGVLLCALNVTVQAICSPQDAAFAAAIYTFMRGLGICMGVAIGGTIFQNALASSLSAARLPGKIAQDAAGYMVKLKALPANSPLRQGLLEAYATAFQRVFQVMTGIGSVGGLLSLLIRHYSMDKGLDSGHVLRRDDLRAHSPSLDFKV